MCYSTHMWHFLGSVCTFLFNKVSLVQSISIVKCLEITLLNLVEFRFSHFAEEETHCNNKYIVIVTQGFESVLYNLK